MTTLLKLLLPWGPVFFGVLLLAPMAAAVMDKMAFPATAGLPSLYLAIPLNKTPAAYRELKPLLEAEGASLNGL